VALIKVDDPAACRLGSTAGRGDVQDGGHIGEGGDGERAVGDRVLHGLDAAAVRAIGDVSGIEALRPPAR
jgi:hypothetical protein